MTPEQQRIQRQNIRNFLLAASDKELAVELHLSLANDMPHRAACVQELIDERAAEV